MDDFWLEVIDDYVAECSELLEDMEAQLLSSDGMNQELANEIFRPLHSFKGSSASIGFNTITEVAHSAENLLSYFHKGQYSSTDHKYVQFFLNFYDYMKSAFSKVYVDKNDRNCIEGSSEIITAANTLVACVQGELNEQVGIVVPADKIVIDLDPGPIKNDLTPQSEDSEPELIDDELSAAFVAESRDCFGIVESKVLALASTPTDKEALEEAFRQIHSFKGNCGIFGFNDLETLGHKVESIFQNIISGSLPAERAVFNSILPLIDVFVDSVEQIEKSGSADIDSLDLYLELLSAFDQDEVETPILENIAPPGPLENTITEKKSKGTKKNVAPLEKRQDIRVDLKKLDILNNLVGELVTVKTMVYEHLRMQSEWENSEKTFRLLDRVTTDLQDVSMGIRMVPVAGLFKKMVRTVHDISIKLDKKVNFEFTGEDTEIDKTIMEKISDPLVHMIRNAVDHGIESIDERAQSGKSDVGSVTLEARNEGGEIWIIIKDDGKGIDRSAILAKAQKLGIIDNDGSGLSDHDVFSMVFLPSFSTAKKVTDISGRGVGMDVVKKNIEAVKGKIDISSEKGKGSTFIIKIPLTLSIIQGMMFQVGQNNFVLPIEVISESVKVEVDDISYPLGEAEMVKVRGDVIPVLKLCDIYSLDSNAKKTVDGILVVIEHEQNKIALLVDNLVGQRETVVKPIPSIFKNIKGVSGCSILGDGGMSLILDVGSLVEFSSERLEGVREDAISQ